MRAREFVVESGRAMGRLKKHQAAVMNPVHKFAGTADRMYDLNRVMMAMACADANGPGPNPPDRESWTGRNNTCHPWTKEEHDMMHHAYDQLGIKNEDAINDWSHEPSDIYTTSPVKSFQGYPR